MLRSLHRFLGNVLNSDRDRTNNKKKTTQNKISRDPEPHCTSFPESTNNNNFKTFYVTFTSRVFLSFSFGNSTWKFLGFNQNKIIRYLFRRLVRELDRQSFIYTDRQTLGSKEFKLAETKLVNGLFVNPFSLLPLLNFKEEKRKEGRKKREERKKIENCTSRH